MIAYGGIIHEKGMFHQHVTDHVLFLSSFFYVDVLNMSTEQQSQSFIRKSPSESVHASIK